LNFFGVKSTPDLLAREKKTEQSAGQICSPSVSVSKSVCACVCVCWPAPKPAAIISLSQDYGRFHYGAAICCAAAKKTKKKQKEKSSLGREDLSLVRRVPKSIGSLGHCVWADSSQLGRSCNAFHSFIHGSDYIIHLAIYSMY